MRTINELQSELQEAKDAGNAAEIADLAFLIEHNQHGGPKTAQYRKSIIQARNRMNSRRYNRRGRSRISVGDEVTLPDGRNIVVTMIMGGSVYREVPGEPRVCCPIKLCTVKDGALERVGQERTMWRDRCTALTTAMGACVAALQVASEWAHVDDARAVLESACGDE